jgi:hypothetical protein
MPLKVMCKDASNYLYAYVLGNRGLNIVDGVDNQCIGVGVDTVQYSHLHIKHQLSKSN